MMCECKIVQKTSKVASLSEEIPEEIMEKIDKNFLEIGIPISIKNANLTRGKYRFYFSISKLNPNQILFIGENLTGEKNKKFKVLGKEVIWLRGYFDNKMNYYIAEIEILQNPIPLQSVVYALMIFFGIVAGYMLLEKVEKVIQVSKPFALAITLFLIIVLINMFK